MPQPLTFDFYNSIIEVPAPDVSLDMQFLIDQIRDVEDDLTPGLAFERIADASGKDDLGGGIFTSITVHLLDDWRIRFEDRDGPETTQVTVSGGNLVGGPGGNPIAPSAFTQVLKLSSAAGTIASPTTANDNINLRYILATMGDKQRAIGNIFYWDPYSGSDSNTGLTPAGAVATFAKAHTLATTGNHDIIFCISSDPSGITTVTETITITKKTLKLRGPGYVFQFVPTSTTDDTIVIASNNVEVSGVFISTAGSGSRNGLTLTGANNALVKDCWMSNIRGNGIAMSESSLDVISGNAIEHCGTSGSGSAILVSDTTTQAIISKCIIFDNSIGIQLEGDDIADNIIENNLIYKHSDHGVTIGTDVARTTLRSGNTFNKNTGGNVSDAGTDTYIETQAGGASASEVADAVWDEVIASHVTSGTAGKTLKDAKVKATLASLA